MELVDGPREFGHHVVRIGHRQCEAADETAGKARRPVCDHIIQLLRHLQVGLGICPPRILQHAADGSRRVYSDCIHVVDVDERVGHPRINLALAGAIARPGKWPLTKTGLHTVGATSVEQAQVYDV